MIHQKQANIVAIPRSCQIRADNLALLGQCFGNIGKRHDIGTDSDPCLAKAVYSMWMERLNQTITISRKRLRLLTELVTTWFVRCMNVKTLPSQLFIRGAARCGSPSRTSARLSATVTLVDPKSIGGKRVVFICKAVCEKKLQTRPNMHCRGNRVDSWSKTQLKLQRRQSSKPPFFPRLRSAG